MTSYDQLKRLLNAGHALTLDTASDRLGVGRRQVRRLLKKMAENGYEITEEYRQGEKHFSLAPHSVEVEATVDLTESELHALAVAGLAARSLLHNTPMVRELSTALKTLFETAGLMYSFEPDTVDTHWHFDAGSTSNVEADVFLSIVQATTHQKTLEIDYYSASDQALRENLKIDPLVIAEQGETWIVAAYVHGRAKVRDFALAGIRRIEETGAAFSWPVSFDPDQHFDDRFHALKGKSTGRVRIAVRSDKAAYFRRKTYHPSQIIEDEREDGSIVVSFQPSSLDDIAAFIRSWGPPVRVLSPASLAERIQAEAEQVRRQYAEVPQEDAFLDSEGASGEM